MTAALALACIIAAGAAVGVGVLLTWYTALPGWVVRLVEYAMLLIVFIVVRVPLGGMIWTKTMTA